MTEPRPVSISTNSSQSTLIQVAPRPGSSCSDSSEMSEEDTPRNVHLLDAVVVGNPHRREDLSIELSVVVDQPQGEVEEQDGAVNSKKQKDAGKKQLRPMGSLDLASPMEEEQFLQNVLDSRPTLRLGRAMSVRYRGSSAFQRGARPSSSLPRPSGSAFQRPLGSEDAAAQSMTLPGLIHRRRSDDSLESLEDLRSMLGEDDAATESTFRQSAALRRSTRRLKERITMHRELESVRASVVRESAWDNFRHVKWPKFKSRFKVVLAWELWKGHMKQVEGLFGTSVVSYFIFLRFLFLMNVVIFALWFGFVVVPAIVFIQVNDPANVESQLACTYEPSGTIDLLCPTDDPEYAVGTNFTLENGTFFFLVSVEGEYDCEISEEAESFLIRECEFGDVLVFEDEFLNVSEEYREAEREGALEVTVASAVDNCTGSGTVRTVRLCPQGIAQRLEWYQYIIDFVLGQGLFNDTILFYGRYGNTTVVGNTYSLPLAYLFVTGLLYTISVVLLVYKLGHAYNESYTQFSSKRRINFCSKVFTAWDFNITDVETAKLKRSHIRTEFEEEIADYDNRKIKRTRKQIAVVVMIRIITNAFTMVVLAAGSAAIFYAAEFGLNNPNSTLEGLVLPVVITTLNLVLPFLFSFLAKFERFKTQSGEIKMTLLRTIIVRLSSLVVLVVTLFILISCTQQQVEETEDDGNTCQFEPQDTFNSVINSTEDDCQAELQQCWETFVGQEFYKLGLTNFAVSAASTIAAETARNVISRVKICGLGEKIGKGNFNIPKSILDLIYTQSLLWLGFFFSPLLPAVIMLTSFVLFYVKKYSLVFNLAPDKRGAFRAARTNFLFILLMLVALFLILLPIGYIIANFNPSESCGPFRGQRFIFTVVTDLVDGLNCAGQQAFDFFSSIGFIIPVVVLLLLVIYAQYVILRARKERFKLVKKQLVLEGANVTHIVGKLDGVLKGIAEHRNQATDTTTNHTQPVNLQARINDVRRLSAQQGREEAEL